jgi:hypothetical protein
MNRPMEMPEAVAKVFITEELQTRDVSVPDYLREKLAIQGLLLKWPTIRPRCCRGWLSSRWKFAQPVSGHQHSPS